MDDSVALEGMEVLLRKNQIRDDEQYPVDTVDKNDVDLLHLPYDTAALDRDHVDCCCWYHCV